MPDTLAANANFCGKPDMQALAFSTVQSYLKLIDEKMTVSH